MATIKVRIQGSETIIETTVDDADFEWLNKMTWKSKKGKFQYMYPLTRIRGLDVYMHKLLCPSEKPLTTDHINRDPLDNRRSNLRVATASQQAANRIHGGGQHKKHSKYRGVTKIKGGNKKPWTARCARIIGGKHKKIQIGTFETEIEAAKAYDAYAIVTWGEFAILNFP